VVGAKGDQGESCEDSGQDVEVVALRSGKKGGAKPDPIKDHFKVGVGCPLP